MNVTMAENLASLYLMRKEVFDVKCQRCGGIMAYEKFYGNCEQFFGWRCVVCGDIVDKVIMENRLYHNH